ncbi:putative bifunctional diguanylate cyclase/phosphodiesterase [Mangrovicoccus ximenensis]|uniref:putative bifunctional diguanylate cyclase/phosphodiesterase n=1 Tax=Mangrovicoccus ximenensis TaxID=1911570 RepID=UPI000D3D4280|nr:bifunctional diguanylate cyclase/phosphodiesterase [Mangrovicoccus ximenensis]
MKWPLPGLRRDWRAEALTLPNLLLAVPALTLGAYWLSGEAGLYLAALGLPAAAALLSMSRNGASAATGPWQTPFDIERTRLEEAAERILRDSAETGRTTACILVSIDDFSRMRDRMGMRAAEEILAQIARRLQVGMRRNDTVASFGDGIFGIVLTPTARADLESLMQICARLQKSAADPVLFEGAQLHVSVSAGFSQPDRLPDATGHILVEAAEAALREAHSRGPGTIRAYTEELHRRRVTQSKLIDEVRDALEAGQIRPWFQPQISTDTGRITGFEALARWSHPERGLVPPAEFLPALEAAALLERLGEVILYNSLSALKSWDRAQVEVPSIGVNFSLAELRNPTLVDRIAWELDRFSLAPERLTVEVLENVISESADDSISRNITGLSRLGCRIDLDDFGTGHSSITNIRRFTVSRLKIDRSFVQRVDEDREQQRMVAAILTMAERLDLDTLAEGVETVGEHTMLSQLGCGHVQGYGIGRPMPFEDTIGWLAEHNAKLVAPPDIGRWTG